MSDGTLGDPPERTLKALDAWWTVLLVDPVAVRLVRAVGHVAVVTPTRITVLAHLLGVASAVLFAADVLLLGAVVFEVRFVLDCADGKLARLRGSSSRAGAFIDYFGDNLVVAANLAALALGLLWRGEVPPAIAMALPVTFLAHITAQQARLSEAIASGLDGQPRERTLPGNYRAWMAARRLRPWPSRIDVEHLLLFVAPIAAAILGDAGVLALGTGLASIYFAYRTARMTVGGYRIAAGQRGVARGDGE